MTTDGKKPKMKLWLRLLLGGSLALNLLVVGLAAGAALRHRSGDGVRPPPSVGAMLFRELDRDTRKVLRRKAGGGHGSYHERRRAEAAEFLALLRADPFDAGAVTAVLQGHAQRREDFQLAVRDAWLAKLTAMSAGQRLEYADELERTLSRGPRFRRGGNDRP